MNDHQNGDPNLDTASLAAPSHRASGSLQNSTGESHQVGPNPSSSGPHSTYEDRVKSLKQQLSTANSRLQGQELRAVNAEEQISALASHLKLVNVARVAAVQEAAKATEELRLYKIQFERARQELRRAQEIIDGIEKERYDTAKAAAEARTLARRYKRELLMMKAMDEGRDLGMQEGFEQSRALALGETDIYEDMNDESYANEYMDYAESDLRPPSLHVASNEEIVVQPSRSSVIESLPPPPPPQPVPMSTPEPVQPIPPPPQPVPVPPPEPVQPVPPPQPVPVPPEPVQPIPPPRPSYLRSPSPSIIPQPISIPPDGYIPTIDPDNFIRMPPPHELIKPPPSPEISASPQLPEASQEEPRPSSQSRIHRRSTSSLASASASAAPRATPLSAIPEAESTYARSIVQDADRQTLRNQPSQSSYRRGVNAEQMGEAGPQQAQSPSIHRRQSAGSNISASSGRVEINVIPPSSSSGRSQHNVPNNTSLGAGGVSRPSVMSQLFGNHVIGQPGAGIPGAYRDQTDQMSTRSSGRRPIDDDQMSFRSGDTLTPPQGRRRSLHQP